MGTENHKGLVEQGERASNPDDILPLGADCANWNQGPDTSSRLPWGYGDPNSVFALGELQPSKEDDLPKDYQKFITRSDQGYWILFGALIFSGALLTAGATLLAYDAARNHGVRPAFLLVFLAGGIISGASGTAVWSIWRRHRFRQRRQEDWYELEYEKWKLTLQEKVTQLRNVGHVSHRLRHGLRSLSAERTSLRTTSRAGSTSKGSFSVQTPGYLTQATNEACYSQGDVIESAHRGWRSARRLGHGSVPTDQSVESVVVEEEGQQSRSTPATPQLSQLSQHSRTTSIAERSPPLITYNADIPEQYIEPAGSRRSAPTYFARPHLPALSSPGWTSYDRIDASGAESWYRAAPTFVRPSDDHNQARICPPATAKRESLTSADEDFQDLPNSFGDEATSLGRNNLAVNPTMFPKRRMPSFRGRYSLPSSSYVEPKFQFIPDSEEEDIDSREDEGVGGSHDLRGIKTTSGLSLSVSHRQRTGVARPRDRGVIEHGVSEASASRLTSRSVTSLSDPLLNTYIRAFPERHDSLLCLGATKPIPVCAHRPSDILEEREAKSTPLAFEDSTTQKNAPADENMGDAQLQESIEPSPDRQLFESTSQSWIDSTGVEQARIDMPLDLQGSTTLVSASPPMVMHSPVLTDSHRAWPARPSSQLTYTELQRLSANLSGVLIEQTSHPRQQDCLERASDEIVTGGPMVSTHAYSEQSPHISVTYSRHGHGQMGSGQSDDNFLQSNALDSNAETIDSNIKSIRRQQREPQVTEWMMNARADRELGIEMNSLEGRDKQSLITTRHSRKIRAKSLTPFEMRRKTREKQEEAIGWQWRRRGRSRRRPNRALSVELYNKDKIPEVFPRIECSDQPARRKWRSIGGASALVGNVTKALSRMFAKHGPKVN